jgi:hypothetical protein
MSGLDIFYLIVEFTAAFAFGASVFLSIARDYQ